MAGLADLAYGLRQAAGVLSPQVSQETFRADEAQLARAENNAAENQRMERQFQLNQSTPQAQMARQQLENEIGFRTAVQKAGGDQDAIASAAMQYGKPEVAMNLYNAREKRAADAQARHDALQQRMQELQMRMEDKAATREQQGQYQQMMVALRRAQISASTETAHARLDLERMRIELAGNATQDKATTEKEKQTVKQTQQLGVALERANIPQTESVISDAEAALKKPGVIEYISGAKSAIPDLLAPKDATDARQAVTKLFNITLKDRSGAAVTTQELERLKDEFGKGLFKKPEQLQQAITKARGIIEAHGRGIAAGYGPEALKNYNENLSAVGGRPILGGTSTPPPPAGFKVD